MLGSFSSFSFATDVTEPGTPVIKSFFGGLVPLRVGPIARVLGIDVVDRGVYQLHRTSAILPTPVRRVLRERDRADTPSRIPIKWENEVARENSL